MTDKHIEMNINDALIEKPYAFSIEVDGKGERHFFIYPVTLGKLHLLKRHMENLEINFDNLQIGPHLEALRVVSIHPKEVARVVAYHTMKRKRDIFDTQLIEETTDFIVNNASQEDLATLLIYLLTKDDIEAYKAHLGITKESERMYQVVQAKRAAQKTKNDFEFGGKTIYGTLIDQACERYGWTYDYVVWGISFINLQLLLADRIQSIYLTDDEKKKVRPSLLEHNPQTLRADDKENQAQILAMDWS